jgi:hypothetical protein
MLDVGVCVGVTDGVKLIVGVTDGVGGGGITPGSLLLSTLAADCLTLSTNCGLGMKGCIGIFLFFYKYYIKIKKEEFLPFLFTFLIY